MPGPTKLSRSQLAKHRPNRIPPTFERLPNGMTVIGVTQKNGMHHEFPIETIMFEVFLNNDAWSFCASPQNPGSDKFYCKISTNGVSMYLHRFIARHMMTTEKTQIHHRNGLCTVNTRDNLEAVSPKEHLAAHSRLRKQQLQT